MKFGLRYCNTGPYAVDTSLAEELVLAGEAAGFESAWTVEHTVVPSGYESEYPYSPDGKMAGGMEDMPMPDPLMWMAYMAGITSTIKFATGILIVPQHNPVVAAKQIATLDYMSGGRALIGIGVGWLREEFEAIGVPFDDRGQRTDEYVAAMRELWTADRPTFHGQFVNFDAAYCRPQPVQDSVPIIVGGDTKIAARRAGRLGDGYFPARGAPPELLDLARSTAVEHGRDPDALEITTSMPDDPDEIPALAARGVSRIVVPVSPVAGLQTAISSPDDVTLWGERVAQYADL
ncbi:MAG: LLM class F420-dependent oxidoreductase [Actinomycetia bacterium]|nr:LLM class F420-dependent oxidoreductase [Actinomycetes bacterium]